MSITPEEHDKVLVDLELEAREALDKVRAAALAAIPILVKLKKEQFKRTDSKLRAFILGTDNPEGQVNAAVRTMLTSALHGIVL